MLGCVRLTVAYLATIKANFVETLINKCMKNFIKFFLTAPLAACLFFSMSAKTDGEVPIPIIISQPGETDNRSPEQALFHAQLWDTYVILSCASSIGNVDVTLTSTAGDDYETVFNTAFGSILIPISGNAGSYRLDIVLTSGQSYYGEFVL